MSEAKKNTFGKNLKKEIDKRGWGQSDFSEKMGVDDATVSRWLRGQNLPHPAQRQKLIELGMSLQELGLIEEDTNAEKDILTGITEIIQTTDSIGIAEKLQLIVDYVAQIASQKHITSLSHPPIKRTDDTSNSTLPSSVEQEAVVIRTEEQEHHFTWIGTRDIFIENVVSIETGNKIASWRYIQNGKEQREPHNFDMHLHVCEGQSIHYHPPIRLVRLHIVPPSAMVRCIPRSSLQA